MGSSELSIETICFDVLGIIKALGFYKKCDMALKVFEWVRNRPDSDKLVNGSVVAVIISMWGKEGQVSAAASFFHNLHNDGFGIDVYAYTSLITIFASNRMYREAVMVFKKMEEEGCKPTLISINDEGLVVDCDRFPMMSVGTSTTCCRRHLVFHGGGGCGEGGLRKKNYSPWAGLEWGWGGVGCGWGKNTNLNKIKLFRIYLYFCKD
ncbi:Pentatricopeptide repeat-containing protein [Abeliophyllum distichum]|uniref:Pentatricopeptide repeat-containing protein n=1 Tax=Abeliophyllum distichum TaxID=126358 RepID=A0ABD1V9U1_9LAMI